MVIWTTDCVNCDVGSIWKSLQMWLLATLRLLPCLPHHHHSFTRNRVAVWFQTPRWIPRNWPMPEGHHGTKKSCHNFHLPKKLASVVSPTAATFYQTKRWNLLWNPVEPDLAAPKPPRPSPETFPEPCWTWPGSAPKPPRPSFGTLLNLTWLCTKASRSLLRNLLRNPHCGGAHFFW